VNFSPSPRLSIAASASSIAPILVVLCRGEGWRQSGLDVPRGRLADPGDLATTTVRCRAGSGGSLVSCNSYYLYASGTAVTPTIPYLTPLRLALDLARLPLHSAFYPGSDFPSFAQVAISSYQQCPNKSTTVSARRAT
jgi:hypothetical protein